MRKAAVHLINGAEHMICCKCKQLKPVGAFDQRTDSPNRRTDCNPCRLAYTKDYQERNREQTRRNQRAYYRRPRGKAISLLNAARNRAADKGERFKLSLADVQRHIEAGYCQKTFLPFNLDPDGKQTPLSPSIDKINPHGIYEPSNVQYVCLWYNSAKQQWTEEVLIEMCRRVVWVDDLKNLSR